MEESANNSTSSQAPSKEERSVTKSENRQSTVINPANIEVPAPPPMEKEVPLSRISLDDSGEDEVGDTVDIPLN